MDTKLWRLVFEPDDDSYDINMEMIVRALSERRARTLASEAARDEGPDVWLDQARCSCTRLTVQGEEEVVLCAGRDG